jgi:hypothetical protein
MVREEAVKILLTGQPAGAQPGQAKTRGMVVYRAPPLGIGRSAGPEQAGFPDNVPDGKKASLGQNRDRPWEGTVGQTKVFDLSI